MKNRDAVIVRIEQLIERLKQPLTPSEAKDGWTEESREVFIKLFLKLAQRLQDKGALKKQEKELYIARGMDHWGIISGDLLEEAAAISNELRQLR